MDNVVLKTRIAMLWVFIALVLLGRTMVSAFGELAAGKPLNVPQTAFLSAWGAGATLFLFAMPVLCLTLKDSPNRWLNVILGFFFTVAGIVGTGSELFLQAASVDLYLMDAAATVAPAVILYYAYRWPKATP